MARRVSFSSKNIDIEDYALHHLDCEKALRFYFNSLIKIQNSRFIGFSEMEIEAELHNRLQELEISSTMTVLAAVEAKFRIDYLQRCYHKEKDEISRYFRKIYKLKETKANLEDDILIIWKEKKSGLSNIISELIGAFKYRHWLAHGRYWQPKLGREYDYDFIYGLSLEILKSIPWLS